MNSGKRATPRHGSGAGVRASTGTFMVSVIDTCGADQLDRDADIAVTSADEPVIAGLHDAGPHPVQVLSQLIDVGNLRSNHICKSAWCM